MFGQHEYVLHEYDPHEYDPQEYDLHDNHDPFDPLDPFSDEGYGENFPPPDFSKSPFPLRRQESILPGASLHNTQPQWVLISRTVDIAIMVVLAAVGMGLGFLWFADRTPTYMDSPSPNSSWTRDLFSLWGTSSMRWLFINVVVAMLVATSGLLSSFGGGSAGGGGDGKQRLGGNKVQFDGFHGQGSARTSESTFIGPAYESPEVYNPFADKEHNYEAQKDTEEVKAIPTRPDSKLVKEAEAGRSIEESPSPVDTTPKEENKKGGDAKPEVTSRSLPEGDLHGAQPKQKESKENEGSETSKEGGPKPDMESQSPEGRSEKDEASESSQTSESLGTTRGTEPDKSMKPDEINKGEQEEESKVSKGPPIEQSPRSESTTHTSQDTTSASTSPRESSVSSRLLNLEELKDMPSSDASDTLALPEVTSNESFSEMKADSALTVPALKGSSKESRVAVKDRADVSQKPAFKSYPHFTLALGTNEETVGDSNQKPSRALSIEGDSTTSKREGDELATVDLPALPPILDPSLATPATSPITPSYTSDRNRSSLPLTQITDSQPLAIHQPQAHISSGRKLRISPPMSPPLVDDIPLRPPPPPVLDLPPTPSPPMVSRKETSNFAEHELSPPQNLSGKAPLGTETSQNPVRYVSIAPEETFHDSNYMRTFSEASAPAVSQESTHPGSVQTARGQPPAKRDGYPRPPAREFYATSMHQSPEHGKFVEQEAPSRRGSSRVRFADGYEASGQHGGDLSGVDPDDNSNKEDPLHQKIESFLAKTHEHWRLQRQESLARYQRRREDTDK